MTPIEKWQKVKDDAEKWQRAEDRAKGALEREMAQLERDHGVSTVEAAEKLLAKLERQAERQAAEFERAEAAFRKKWEGKL